MKDSKYTGVRDEIPRQVFFAFMENDFAGSAVMYVRTQSQPDAGVRRDPSGRATQLDPNIPIYNLRTLEHQIDQSLLNDRLIATLSTAFGVLATLLAVIGLYGVMAYTVARRTREIGVRMALGAVQGDVVWLVMREVLTLVGTGIVLGLVAAWGVSRVVSSQLYGVTAERSADDRRRGRPARRRRAAGRLHPRAPCDARQPDAGAAVRVTRKSPSKRRARRRSQTSSKACERRRLSADSAFNVAVRQTSYCRNVRLNLPLTPSSGGAVPGMMRDTP